MILSDSVALKIKAMAEVPKIRSFVRLFSCAKD
jgi:hypothetical protein